MAIPQLNLTQIIGTSTIAPTKFVGTALGVDYSTPKGQMFGGETLNHPRHSQEPGTVGYADYNPAAQASALDILG